MASRFADYVSSLRTVGLCVFSAVVFGVGVGFIDGVGKAYMFFAGYDHENLLELSSYNMHSPFAMYCRVSVHSRQYFFLNIRGLSNNNIHDSIPYQLSPNLTSLNLAGNNLSGSIPYSLSTMGSLNYS